MIKTKQLFFIFIPAILFGALVFFIRFLQYEPLYPKLSEEPAETAAEVFQIPFFPDDPILGDKRAPTTIVAFEDFGCEGCKTQSDFLDQLSQEYPKRFKVVWKGLPVTRFPYQSRPSHIFAYCANQQGQFYEFQQRAFANSYDLSDAILLTIAQDMDLDQQKFDTCVVSAEAEAYVQKTETLAKALSIQAVPTIFIDNKQIQPPTTKEGWVALLRL